MKQLLYLSMIFCSYAGFSQKPFEGRIDYKVEYLSVPEGKEGVEQMLPQNSKWVVRGEETRISQHVPFAGWQVLIYNPSIDSFYQQIELFDRNMLFAEKLSDHQTDFRFVEREETKEHLGYDLQRGVLQSASGVILEVWFHKKFKNTAGSELAALPYLPLIFEVERKGIRYQLTATKISPESIDNTYFIHADDAVRIHKSDLLKILK